MLKLDRSTVAAPACLSELDYLNQGWKDLGSSCKRQLRSALVQLQGIEGTTTADASEYGVRCAYCEGPIYHEGHIEHFRRKHPHHENGFPELTFAWENLFLACGADEHCGHYKDRPSAPLYDPAHLVKPDEHDAGEYLYFHSSGEVRAQQTLQVAGQHRAAETVRVFGLNHPKLKGARARAVRSYRMMKQADFEELAAWDDAERGEYFRSEIEATQSQPYATIIKHFLQTTS